MTYTITNTSGSTNYSINDNSLNRNDIDLTFIGRGYTSYGSALNTNFLKLLENFANTTAPTNPVMGQLWYDSINGQLKVYNGSSFVGIAASNTTLTIGDLYFENDNINSISTNANINIVPNGSGFTVVNNLGINNAKTGRMLFTAPNGAVTSTTMSYTLTGDSLTVTSLNATNLAGLITTAEQNSITSIGTLNSLNVTGNVAAGNLVASTYGVYAANYYWANGAAFNGYGVYSNTNVSQYLPTYTGNISAGNISVSGNLRVTGTATLTASSAKYADLAEKYEADALYEPGTVVDFGGVFDVTLSTENSTRVAGIVSTNPAYLMNNEASGQFMVSIALTGRVPCKVKGFIEKGDLLVSSGNGYAVANNSPRIGSVVGKALRDHAGNTGVIEVAVGRY